MRGVEREHMFRKNTTRDEHNSSSNTGCIHEVTLRAIHPGLLKDEMSHLSTLVESECPNLFQVRFNSLNNSGTHLGQVDIQH